MSAPARIAYADPPYPGCARLYKGHADYAGEVDHVALVARLIADYDGFVLHTASTTLADVLPLVPRECRLMAWVKPFAAFKRNVSVAYAGEPVIIRAVRKPVVRGRIVMRDWVSESITMKKGLTGAKPRAVARWAFEMLGAEPTDTLDDLFPGTGAISDAWNEWQSEFREPARESCI